MFHRNLSYSTLLKNPPPFPEMYKYNLPQFATKTKKRRWEKRKILHNNKQKKENFKSTAQKSTNSTLLVCFLTNILKLCFKA